VICGRYATITRAVPTYPNQWIDIVPPEGLRTPRPISSIDRLYYEFVLLSSSHGCVKGSRQKDQSIPAHRDRQAAW
ncbi:MAG: hypothetical protein ACRDQ2_18810, partial [Gaiellales bacterium]